MTAEKTGPSDGSYNDIYNNDNSEKDKKKTEKDELYKKEMEELKKAGEEMKEREAEKIEQAKKNRESRKEREGSGRKKKTEMDGQIVEKKIYSHEEEGGIFIKGKATNYSQKIDKALRRKVHGVSLAKKKELAEIIKNCASRKTTVTEKEVGDILSKLKYGNYTGSGSSGINRMLKNMEKEGVDLKSYKKELKKKFSRRDIDKFKIALGGGKDPRKHKMRSGLNKSANKASRSGSTSPNRIGRGF